MLLAQHQMIAAPSGMTPRRAMIIGGVGLLHAVVIYALINGMATTALHNIENVIQLSPVETKTPPKPVPLPPQPPLVQPTQPTVQTLPPPDIVIETTQAPPITVAPTTPTNLPPPDSSAAGLSNTHTTPPYPAEARTLSHQGTVLLQMLVSAQGDVTSATVLQSSGFPELDQAAMTWVVAHWKYKPALQGGVAMASQTQAAVKFDLKQAHR